MTLSSSLARILALAVPPLLGLACARSPDEALAPEPACTSLHRAKPASRVNVILVVSDTMRRDRMGLYGGPAKTPAFDRFARANLWFDRAFTAAPWTKPAMATLFTSLYPSQHGLTNHPELRLRAGDPSWRSRLKSDVLGDGFVTLAEILREHGYRTAAFVSNPWMVREFGFAQGFDLYEDSFARWSTTGRAVTRAALGWLAALRDDQPFFLYVHYIDAHRPYGKLGDDEVLAALDGWREDYRDLPPEGREFYNTLIHSPRNGFSPRVVERLRAAGPILALIERAYDRGVETFDEEFARLLEGLGERLAGERTALLVTSDHGEALYDRGYGNHGIDLYDDEVAIPLAVRLPGVTAPRSRIDCSASIVDLLPTLCDYLDLDCPPSLAGRSLLAGEQRSAYVIAEGTIYRPENRSLRNERYKLIHRPRGDYRGERSGWDLYDLENDPGEKRDLLAMKPQSEETRHVLRTLASRLAQAVAPFATPAPELATVDAETEERLRALGYLD